MRRLRYQTSRCVARRLTQHVNSWECWLTRAPLSQDFLSAVETHGQLELPTAPEEMSSERLTTGVWVQGKFAADNKPENEKSALFIAIPYLGEVLYDSENPESIRLSDFDGIAAGGAAGGAAGAAPPGSPATTPELAVHQARFIVYNNSMTATVYGGYLILIGRSQQLQ